MLKYVKRLNANDLDHHQSFDKVKDELDLHSSWLVKRIGIKHLVGTPKSISANYEEDGGSSDCRELTLVLLVRVNLPVTVYGKV